MYTLSYKRDKKILTFEDNGQEYTIGSKLFPLSQKKNIGMWTADNTEEVKKNHTFLQYLDAVSNHTFTTGKCYRNAEVVRKVGEMLKLNIKFYSGWIFYRDTMPLHHAWNVLDNRILIDTSITVTHNRIHERVAEYLLSNLNLTVAESRQEYIRIYEEEDKKRKPISQELMYGKVARDTVYIGTQSSYEESMDIICKLLDGNEHPAYLHNRNEKGESDLQIMLKEKGLY